MFLQNGHNKERCLESLSHESNKILYNANPPTDQLRGLTVDQPARQRSTSGCSSGSDGPDMRARSDSTGSRNSLPGCNITAAGTGGGSQNHYGVHPGMHHSATTPAFTVTHQAYVNPGPTTAPVPTSKFDIYMNQPSSQGFAFPPSIPCSVSSDNRQSNMYPGASGGYVPHTSNYVPTSNSGPQRFATPNPQGTNGSAPVPYPSSAGSAGGFGAQWINSNVNALYPQQAPTVIHPNNQPNVYPYQKTGAAWNYGSHGIPGNSTTADSNMPNRPEHFNQGFPQAGRPTTDSSPHLHGSASLPYLSPDHSNNQSPTTPTRPAVTPPSGGHSGSYGMSSLTLNNYGGSSPGYHYMPGNTPPGANPAATHVSAVFIPVNVKPGITTPPVNPPSNVYVPRQPGSYPPVGGKSLPHANQINSAAAGGYDNRPPVYPQSQPKRPTWNNEGLKSDWTDKDPAQERFMQTPMQPIVTPSPSSSGGVSLPNFDVFGLGQASANRRHSAGSEDSAYSQGEAHVLHFIIMIKLLMVCKIQKNIH